MLQGAVTLIGEVLGAVQNFGLGSKKGEGEDFIHHSFKRYYQ